MMMMMMNHILRNPVGLCDHPVKCRPDSVRAELFVKEMIGYLSNEAGGGSIAPFSPSGVAASPFSSRRLNSIKFSRTVLRDSVVCLLDQQVRQWICGEYWQVSAVTTTEALLNGKQCLPQYRLKSLKISCKGQASIFTWEEMGGECSIGGIDWYVLRLQC